MSSTSESACRGAACYALGHHSSSHVRCGDSHSLLTCSTMDPMRPTDRVFDGPAITLEPSFTTTRRAEARSALSINGHGPPFETPEKWREVVLPKVCRMPLEAARLNRQNDIAELLPRCHYVAVVRLNYAVVSFVYSLCTLCHCNRKYVVLCTSANYTSGYAFQHSWWD